MKKEILYWLIGAMFLLLPFRAPACVEFYDGEGEDFVVGVRN